MTTLQQEMNRMFDDFFSGFDFLPSTVMEESLSRFAPNIDVKETPKEIKVMAELPGMDEKDISISLEDDFLLIKGERQEEKKEDDEEYFYREISSGSFRRMIPLTAKVDADKVEAEFKKGVLKVTLPKVAGAESEKAKKIEITRTAA
ncbi:MAG: Hsp20/alpha crystallin family protein [Desulfurivibrionaceae bacterium]|nr:Hsp20/alpha crystallin family protein [Desulfurivibrionaceae bacterium]